MRKQIAFCFFILTFILTLELHASAQMQSSTYRIPTSVLSGGGAPMSSGSYQMNSTMGQPSPLMQGDQNPWSTNYDLYPGFWYTIGESGVTCPGDFDGDSDVDGSDLATFATDFGRTDCDTGDECEGDFYEDNNVDGSDLAVFAADFGRTDCLP